MTIEMLVKFFAQFGQTVAAQEVRKAIRHIETTIHAKLGRRDGKGGVFYFDTDVDCIAFAMGINIPDGEIYKG